MDEQWQTIGNPKFSRWEQQTIEGTWDGTFPGDYGLLGRLQTAKGPISFSLPTVLQTKLATIKVGDQVKITHLGKTQGRSGRSYHDFVVRVAR